MQKDVLLAVCALITAAAIVVAVNSFEKQNKLSKTLQEERYSRMVAEESSQKSAAKVATLDNELKIAQEKMGKIKGILDEEKNTNSDLKTQYDKLVRTKADLEAKLKATLDEEQQRAAALAAQVQAQTAPQTNAAAAAPPAPAATGTN